MQWEDKNLPAIVRTVYWINKHIDSRFETVETLSPRECEAYIAACGQRQRRTLAMLLLNKKEKYTYIIVFFLI